jgi:hypothetical protein
MLNTGNVTAAPLSAVILRKSLREVVGLLMTIPILNNLINSKISA